MPAMRLTSSRCSTPRVVETLVLIWLTLTIPTSEQASCSKNQSSLQWLVPPVIPADGDQRNYVGKEWRIDCRLNDSLNDAILLQGTRNGPPWRERLPDRRTIIKKHQMFILRSSNNSDVGHYYCKVCNLTKYVGKLSSDTSKEIPVVYPSSQRSIPAGEKVNFTCRAKGVYAMAWLKVASNGSKSLTESREESFWHRGYRFTRLRLDISNFQKSDESLYMCRIFRPADNYSAEKEIYLRLKEPDIPVHWYYTTFSRQEIDGHMMLFMVHVYACHLPVIASVMVFEPVKGILWRKNFTADQTEALRLELRSKYGVRLEMHMHPEGQFKDHLHVTVYLDDLPTKQSRKTIDRKLNIKTQCNREKCRQIKSNSLQCHRYLDDLDEQLNATLVLTLQDPCARIFKLQIYDREGLSNRPSNSLLNLTFGNNTQARMQLKGFKNLNISSTVQGRVMFSQWYLSLIVQDNSKNVYRVKLLLDMPDVGLRGKFLIMEGDYRITKPHCPSRGRVSGGDQTKTIVIVIVVLFIAGLLLYAGAWLYRRHRNRSSDTLLLSSMDDDAL